MPREEITTPRIAKPVGPYSAGIRREGFTFVSGQVAQDPETGELFEGDVGVQTKQALGNLKAIVEASGRSLEDVVRVGVYLTDMDHFNAMGAEYEEFFRKPYPARTTIVVSALPLGAAVEIDAIVG
jgi:2-iminobutanoate/2-iminopropanoate deaminase